ncbi:MAG: putative isomerase, partial [Oceanospirillaceae bacterium]
MQSFYRYCLIGLMFLAGCTGQTEQSLEPIKVQAIADALNYVGHPDQERNDSIFFFTDMGAWYGHGLPDERLESWGFVGPKLLTEQNGVWLGDRTMKLDLTGENGKPILPNKSESRLGKLVQNGAIDGLSFELELGFLNPTTSLLELTVKNESEDSLTIDAAWSGEFFKPVNHQSSKDGILRFTSNSGKTHIAFGFLDESEINADSSGYKTRLVQHEISVGKELKRSAFQIVTFDSTSLETEIASVLGLTESFGKLIDDRATEWQIMLDDIGFQDANESEQIILQKSLQTLIGNWRSSAGELKHDGLFPSAAIRWFHGFWAWDSWKHSVAIARFNPELAKNQVRAMFDFQDEHGMIADCVFRDTSEERHNWRNTKSPLAAWAVAEIYNHDPDKEFAAEMLPKLQRYHDWWYSHRDQNQNELCEFGSTDGTAIAAAWESGMDNAVRFDSVSLGLAGEGAWTFDQESVDLNAYLCAEKRFLAELYRATGDNSKAENLEKESGVLAEFIRASFWDEEAGYFFDRHIKEVGLMHQTLPEAVYGPECWTVLWAGIATQEQAEKVVSHIMNDSQFNTKVPCPTLDASHPKFNPKKGYWRGPVWLDQVYFA